VVRRDVIGGLLVDEPALETDAVLGSRRRAYWKNAWVSIF
jgi:hypothetical protein